ncbi:GNAT family N-acetyltransferase [Maritimibacter sp. 55A14]|uniref:GNAT family N-acetyltransferase n=1 Tax=Maritimibacter sp. 55A14 TaxID=2174844 RepID=UPI001E2AC8CE|nr:GNAT family N-acetyltransferase [Maritimibacter sp. 55A14]
MIAQGDPALLDAAALIAAHLALMRAVSPPGSIHAMDGGALAAPGIRFYLLHAGGAVQAMGALRRLDARHGELKSMHTAEAARGRGFGAAMLRHLIGEARAQGMTRLSLETGTHDAFAASRRFYANHGFRSCAPFAAYRPDPHSCFMSLDLEQGLT